MSLAGRQITGEEGESSSVTALFVATGRRLSPSYSEIDNEPCGALRNQLGAKLKGGQFPWRHHLREDGDGEHSRGEKNTKE